VNEQNMRTVVHIDGWDVPIPTEYRPHAEEYSQGYVDAAKYGRVAGWTNNLPAYAAGHAAGKKAARR
jgi:hypothetical protein